MIPIMESGEATVEYRIYSERTEYTRCFRTFKSAERWLAQVEHDIRLWSKTHSVERLTPMHIRITDCRDGSAWAVYITRVSG